MWSRLSGTRQLRGSMTWAACIGLATGLVGCGGSAVTAPAATAPAAHSGGGSATQPLTQADLEAIERSKQHPVAQPEPRPEVPAQQPPPQPQRPLYPEQTPPAQDTGAAAETDEAVVSETAPPPAQQEAQPASPGPDYV